MALKPCHECGADVSTEAGVCPTCKSRFFHAVCNACNEPIGKRFAPSVAGVHVACAEPLVKRIGRCRECGTVIWSEQNWLQYLREFETKGDAVYGGFRLACGNCGARDPLGYMLTLCNKCRLPILTQLHPDSVHLEEKGYYHARCQPNEKQGIRLGCIMAVLLVAVALIWLYETFQP